MSNWTIIYYESEKGDCPVQDFIQSRKTSNRAKILAWIRLLEEKGPNLPRPYADILKDGIHELRIKLSGDQIRILYFFCYKDFVILTHAFTKTSKKVQKSEIDLAKKYKKDFLENFNESQLREARNEDL